MILPKRNSKIGRKSLITLISICILTIFCSQIVETTSAQTNYWFNRNNQNIPGGLYYVVYEFLTEGTDMTGYIETSDTSEGIDFVIFDEANFALWDAGYSATGYHIRYSMHTLGIEFEIPYSDTWYFVFYNDGFFSVTVDLYLDKNTDHSPYFSPVSYDFYNNYHLMEPNYYHYRSLGLLEKGRKLAGSYSTMFTTDGVIMYVLDDLNFGFYEDGLSFYFVYYATRTYSNSFNVKIPADDQYYIVFSTTDETDTITLSYGVKITNPIITLLVILGSSVAVVGIGIGIVVAVKKKKRDTQQQLFHEQGLSPPVEPTQTQKAYPPSEKQIQLNEEDGDRRFCLKCGMKLVPEAEFCPRCGRSLKP